MFVFSSKCLTWFLFSRRLVGRRPGCLGPAWDQNRYALLLLQLVILFFFCSLEFFLQRKKNVCGFNFCFFVLKKPTHYHLFTWPNRFAVLQAILEPVWRVLPFLHAGQGVSCSLLFFPPPFRHDYFFVFFLIGHFVTATISPWPCQKFFFRFPFSSIRWTEIATLKENKNTSLGFSQLQSRNHMTVYIARSADNWK